MQPAHALVYDRDPITLTAVAAVLHSAGYECLCARTGEAVKKAVAGHPLDLVIWDMGTDLEASMALLQEARGTDTKTTWPVILLADAKDVERITQSFVADATYCLGKPYDPRTLIDLARQATWMPHLVSQHRVRGTRPSQSGWVTL